MRVKTKFSIFTILILIFQVFFSAAQEKNTSISDRIQQLQSISQPDSLLNARFDIIRQIKYSNYSLFLELANKNIKLADSLNYDWALIDIYMEMGELFVEKGNYSFALDYLNKALKLAQNNEYRPYKGWVTLAIGNCYEAMENRERAIYFYELAYMVFSVTNEEEGTALAATNIGTNYMYLNEFGNAGKFLQEGLRKRMALDNYIETGYVKMYLAELQLRKKDYLEAENEINSLIKEIESKTAPDFHDYQLLDASVLVGNAYCLLAECMKYQEKNDLKYDYLFEAARIFKESENILNHALVLNLIGKNYLHDGQSTKAIQYAKQASELTSGTLILNQQVVANKILADAYNELEQYQIANSYLKKYVLINDSMFRQAVIDAITDVDVLIETVQKEKDKEILTVKLEAGKKQRLLIVLASLAFLLFLSITSVYIYRLFRKEQKLNVQLKDKNTQISEQAEKLKELNNELHLLVKSKDRFNSIIAHDLKNPMGALLNISELLVNEFDSFSDEEKKELAIIALETSKKTLDLLENLLAWSRVQGGHLKVQKTCFEVTREVEQTIKNLKHIADLKSIRVELKNNGKSEVYADKEMISTVVRNLFSNAVKFTDEGKKITVGIHKDDELVEVFVEDEGIGIPGSELEKLFSIDSDFQRIGTNKELGTGLGLQLSNEFVKLNDGSINVKSRENLGSRFTFFLPIYKSDNFN